MRRKTVLGKVRTVFLLYRKYRVAIKCESDDSYRTKSPAGQDAHLAEWKIAVNGTARARRIRQSQILFYES